VCSEEREMDRLIRQEQDMAYEESLRADQEKVLSRMQLLFPRVVLLVVSCRVLSCQLT
jgi:hypothetical protein